VTVTHEQMLEIAQRNGYVQWHVTGVVEKLRRVRPKSRGCAEQEPILAGNIDLELGRVKWHRIKKKPAYNCSEVQPSEIFPLEKMLTFRSFDHPDMQNRIIEVLNKVVAVVHDS
jgi:hypothetical protein